jgi:hypothetical protein
VAGAMALLVLTATFGVKEFRDKLAVDLRDYTPTGKTVWLNQNWGATEREWFHHVDTGSNLKIPHE